MATEARVARDAESTRPSTMSASRDSERPNNSTVPSILVSPSSPHQRSVSIDSDVSGLPTSAPTAEGVAEPPAGVGDEEQRQATTAGPVAPNAPTSASISSPSVDPISPRIATIAPAPAPSATSPPPRLGSSSSSNSKSNARFETPLKSVEPESSESGSIPAPRAASAMPEPSTTSSSNANNPLSSFSFSSFLPSLSNIIPRLTNTPTLHLVTSSDENQPEVDAPGISHSSPTTGTSASAFSSASSRRGRNDSTAFLRSVPGHFSMNREKNVLAEEDEESADAQRRWSMDLHLDEATANGETFQEAEASGRKPGTTTGASPARGLQRRPSAAFVAASRGGPVHPLTLQAVARQGSEGEALKLVREREERERQLATVNETGDGTRPATLVRKQSWTAALSASYSTGTTPSHSRSTSHDLDSSSSAGTRTPRARQTSNGLAPVRETRSHADESSAGETDGTVKKNGNSESVMAGPAPSEFGEATSASTGSNSTEKSTSTKKRGFFSRLGGNRNRAPSNLSVRSTDTVSSRSSIETPIVSGFDGSPLASPGIERSATMTSKKDGAEKIRYAKVKTKGKDAKDFGKLFLAQELFVPPPFYTPPTPASATNGRGRSDTIDTSSTHSHDDAASEPPTSPEDPLPGIDKTKKKNAVWCVKWSDDGRYLAVGGKDGVVRVWEVLKTSEERSNATSADGLDESPYQLKVDPTLPIKPSAAAGSSAAAHASSNKKKTPAPRRPVSAMPVFNNTPIREYKGHEADVLDLSWSKNNFLLSSSMDKTVRLWHITRPECLCAFQHLDFVTSIAFHPKDDRYFLSGSLDCKLRLWDIPNRRVQIWTELPELITSVAFSRDGKLSIAGSFNGQCMFFETETFHYHAMFAAKSSRGKNSKGRKITSMMPYPLPSSAGERLLITSNDSRIRLYHAIDKTVEAKYAGHENTSSQIRASFSEDGKYIISGSEDRCVYIWDSGLSAEREDTSGWNPLKKAKEGAGYEWFSMPANIVTCACFAPMQTRDTLAASEDPIFGDGHTHLVPLMKTMSGASLGTESSHLVPTNTRASRLATASPADDAIIVVADDATGVISVFRNSKLPTEARDGGVPKRRMSRSSAVLS